MRLLFLVTLSSLVFTATLAAQTPSPSGPFREGGGEMRAETLQHAFTPVDRGFPATRW